MIQFYMSGLRSAKELETAVQTGLEHVLIDPWSPGAGLVFKHVILDSGAYRRRSISLEGYVQMARQVAWDLVIQQDVMGDREATWQSWRIMRDYCDLSGVLDVKWAPVWPYGEDSEALKHLDKLIGQVGKEAIAVGMLARSMHENNGDVLEGLAAVLMNHNRPGLHWHLLGLGWCEAISTMKAVAREIQGSVSFDTTHWLAGFKTRSAIHRDLNGRLVKYPIRRLHLPAQMTAKEISVMNARAIHAFCEDLDDPWQVQAVAQETAA